MSFSKEPPQEKADSKGDLSEKGSMSIMNQTWTEPFDEPSRLTGCGAPMAQVWLQALAIGLALIGIGLWLAPVKIPLLKLTVTLVHSLDEAKDDAKKTLSKINPFDKRSDETTFDPIDIYAIATINCDHFENIPKIPDGLATFLCWLVNVAIQLNPVCLLLMVWWLVPLLLMIVNLLFMVWHLIRAYYEVKLETCDTPTWLSMFACLFEGAAQSAAAACCIPRMIFFFARHIICYAMMWWNVKVDSMIHGALMKPQNHTLLGLGYESSAQDKYAFQFVLAGATLFTLAALINMFIYVMDAAKWKPARDEARTKSKLLKAWGGSNGSMNQSSFTRHR